MITVRENGKEIKKLLPLDNSGIGAFVYSFSGCFNGPACIDYAESIAGRPGFVLAE